METNSFYLDPDRSQADMEDLTSFQAVSRDPVVSGLDLVTTDSEGGALASVIFSYSAM